MNKADEITNVYNAHITVGIDMGTGESQTAIWRKIEMSEIEKLEKAIKHAKYILEIYTDENGKFTTTAELFRKDLEAFKIVVQELEKMKRENIILKVAKEEAEELLENSIPKQRIEEKIAKLEIIIEETDLDYKIVEEQKDNGEYVYKQIFNVEGYIARAIMPVLKDLIKK